MRRVGVWVVALVGAMSVVVGTDAWADAVQSARWVERFRFVAPPVESSGVCTGEVGRLPSVTVTPDRSATRLVRVSLPFAPEATPPITPDPAPNKPAFKRSAAFEVSCALDCGTIPTKNTVIIKKVNIFFISHPLIKKRISRPLPS